MDGITLSFTDARPVLAPGALEEQVRAAAPRLAEAPEAGDKAASLGGEGNQTLCAAQVFIGFPHFSLLCGRGVCPPGSCPGRQTGF